MESKTKIKEFIKQYFAYNQNDKKLSAEVKEELENLGAHKPFYSESNDERAIRLTRMFCSDNEEIKNIVLKEVQKFFSINNVEESKSLLNEIKTHQSNLDERMRRMKEAKKKNE